MKHLEYYDVNNFRLVDVDIPKCKSNEVLIKVISVGLCGSDVQKLLKQKPDNGYLKTNILGHEIYGQVVSYGSNVKNVKMGQIVVVNPFVCLDKCYCACPNYGLCNKVDIVGRTIDGGYSEYVRVDSHSVHKADELSFKQGIFIDDVAVALHGIHIAKDLGSNVDNIAVIGDGPLGLLVYRLCKFLFGTSNVVLFSKNPKKIKNLGNIKYVKFGDKKMLDKFDIVFEAVGGNQNLTLEMAISLAKPNGFVGVYGVFPFMYKPMIDVRNAFYKQLTIKGFNSFCRENKDFDNAIKFVKKGFIKVDDLVTDVVHFNDIEKFLKSYLSNKADKIKVVFTFDQVCNM